MRMLVVDDDAMSRELLALLLTREGYHVETADCGEAALLYLETMKDSRPEVVLADVQMPGISGAELARRMRSVCGSDTVLLAMSGSRPEEATLSVFDGFLRKPFTMDALAAAIRDRSGEYTSEDDRKIVALDETVYHKLLTSMSHERLDQLYALCLKDAETRIASMRRSAFEGDDASYRREAHAIKGGCGMVGAVELQTIATSMENLGLASANYVASLDEFMVGCRRLQSILVARASENRAQDLSGEDVP